jgi:hypothetical protein
VTGGQGSPAGYEQALDTAPSPAAVLPYEAQLSPAQRSEPDGLARDTWRFYSLDVDKATNLPMDNLTFAGGSA